MSEQINNMIGLMYEDKLRYPSMIETIKDSTIHISFISKLNKPNRIEKSNTIKDRYDAIENMWVKFRNSDNFNKFWDSIYSSNIYKDCGNLSPLKDFNLNYNDKNSLYHKNGYFDIILKKDYYYRMYIVFKKCKKCGNGHKLFFKDGDCFDCCDKVADDFSRYIELFEKLLYNNMDTDENVYCHISIEDNIKTKFNKYTLYLFFSDLYSSLAQCKNR